MKKNKSSDKNSNRIEVGTLGKVHGLKGFIRFFTVYEELLYPEIRIKLLFDFEKNSFIPELVRNDHHKGLFVKFCSFDDRTSIEKNIGKILYSFAEEFPPFPNGKYFFFQLHGIEVFDSLQQKIGVVSDIQKLSQYDLYEVTTLKETKFYIPAVPEYVQNIDIGQRKMIIQNFSDLMRL